MGPKKGRALVALRLWEAYCIILDVTLDGSGRISTWSGPRVAKSVYVEKCHNL